MELPSGLVIRLDSVINVEPSESNIGFYPRSEYLLVEITGRLSESVFKTRKLITSYTRAAENRRSPVAFRAVGPGISIAILLVHLMRTEEKIYSDEMNFTTFAVRQNNRDKVQTGIQIVLFPKGESS